MLPEKWKLATVGDIFDVQLGKMLNKIAKEQNPQFQYLGNTNVKWGRFDLSELKSMYFSDKEKTKFTLLDGDVVLCEGGEVGRCAIWRNDAQEIFYQKALHRLRSKGDIVPEFFQSYMENIAGTKLLEDYTTRTSIAHLTREKLLRLPVKVPPLDEQQKIAQILSTWDKAITTTEQLLANSNLQRVALKHHLLTGKKRLAAHTSKWKLIPFENLLAESRTPGTTGDIAKKLTVKLYGQGVIAKHEKRAGSESTKYFKRKAGQFIYSKLDFLNGAFGIIPDELDGFESTLDLPAFDFESHVDATWFINFVSRPEFYAAHLGLANGGRKARRVNPKDLLKLKAPIPDYTEQRDIALVLAAADRTVEAHRRTLEVFRSQKKALMQQLLSGKRRVKVGGEKAA